MKTIKDAVIELGGKWDSQSQELNYLHYCSTIGFFSSPIDSSEAKYPTICSRSEFESCAKRLGYINGYRWGVEYPTNGKRPDLPDTLFVKYQHKTDGEWLNNPFPVESWAWEETSMAFKIVDEAYKPADTSYLNQCEYKGVSDIDQMKVECMGLIYDKPVDEVSGLFNSEIPFAGKVTAEPTPQNSSWHERGELPPVGTVCEALVGIGNGDHDFRQVEILKQVGNSCACFCIGDEFLKWSSKFRPIRTEREKVIEAAMNVAERDCPECGIKILGALYNAGMLVLPPKKSDTEG